MSSAGPFTIVTNDGKIDKLLLASDFLKRNLEDITNAKIRSNYKDPTPTISDIEKTHILFFSNSFSPFVSLAFEYSKVSPTGSSTAGGSLTFSIPFTGDLFTDIVFRAHFSEVKAARLNESTEYLRYCDYVGEKLFKNVEFTINGNKIDKYDYDVMPIYREYRLLDHKRNGWDKMNGQELKHCAYGSTLSGRGNLREVVQVVDGLQTPKQVHPEFNLYIPMMSWFCGDARDAIPLVSIPYCQRLVSIEINETKNFLQHAGISPVYDNPMKNPPPDPTLKVDMYVNSIYVNTEVHDILINQISFNMVRLYQKQTSDLRNTEDNIRFTQFKFPIEIIYWSIIPDENRDVNSPKMLSSWWKSEKLTKVEYQEACCPNFMRLGHNQQASINMNTQIGQITYENLLTPGNFVLANGFDISSAMLDLVNKPDQKFISLLPVGIDDNPRISSVRQFYEILEYVGYAGSLNWDVTFNTMSSQANLSTTLGQMIVSTTCTKCYEKSTPVARQIGLESHGVMINNMNDIEFYNSYLPWRYGAPKVRTPSTVGNGVIIFSLLPGEHQPSGYFNLSRARETDFKYSQTCINSNYTAKFIAIGIAINFMLISDGSAIIRYGT